MTYKNRKNFQWGLGVGLCLMFALGVTHSASLTTSDRNLNTQSQSAESGQKNNIEYITYQFDDLVYTLKRSKQETHRLKNMQLTVFSDGTLQASFYLDVSGYRHQYKRGDDSTTPQKLGFILLDKKGKRLHSWQATNNLIWSQCQIKNQLHTYSDRYPATHFKHLSSKSNRSFNAEMRLIPCNNVTIKSKL